MLPFWNTSQVVGLWSLRKTQESIVLKSTYERRALILINAAAAVRVTRDAPGEERFQSSLHLTRFQEWSSLLAVASAPPWKTWLLPRTARLPFRRNWTWDTKNKNIKLVDAATHWLHQSGLSTMSSEFHNCSALQNWRPRLGSRDCAFKRINDNALFRCN